MSSGGLAGFEEDSCGGSCACVDRAANSRKTAAKMRIVLPNRMLATEVSLYSDSV